MLFVADWILLLMTDKKVLSRCQIKSAILMNWAGSAVSISHCGKNVIRQS